MSSSPTFIFLIFLQLLTSFTGDCHARITHPGFETILVFGDSTVDTGNNNYINTFFKANHTPYGQDFPGGVATGRNSNGKLVPDFLASFLGIKDLVPPFLDPSLPDAELYTGVNFASGGSGYDDKTGSFFSIIPVSKQINEHFRNYINRLQGIAGDEESKKIISNALVMLVAGTNDFALKSNVSTEYQDFILKRLQESVEELYNLGCRTMIVSGLPPYGCLPIRIVLSGSVIFRKCVEDANTEAQVYNQKLANLLPQIQATLPGSKIIYVDIYEPINNMLTNPKKYGFAETKKGCCGSFIAAGPLCDDKRSLCQDASQYLFWDSLHPSLATYEFLSEYLENEIIPQLESENSIPVQST